MTGCVERRRDALAWDVRGPARQKAKLRAGFTAERDTTLLNCRQQHDRYRPGAPGDVAGDVTYGK